MIAILLSLLGGYLLGSVPFGLIVGKLHGVDVRQHGSKNIGATNVWRVCGWKAGLPVFILDVAKGVAAVWVGWLAARQFSGPADWCVVVAAMACILGHSFPLWLRFKGGKGVATSAGVLIAWVPMAFLIALGTWIVVFAVSRYVSLASIMAAVVLPFAVWGTRERGTMVGIATLISLLAIYKHRANIQRLIAGTENRIGKKKVQS